MSDSNKSEVEELREKLNKALRERAALYQKSKQLEERIKDSHSYQRAQEELTRELLERQRELNFMLNRANIMLSRTQEANALLSIEFTDIVKALPEPKAKEFESRIERINELFKKTGASMGDPDSEISNSRTKQNQAQKCSPHPSENGITDKKKPDTLTRSESYDMEQPNGIESGVSSTEQEVVVPEIFPEEPVAVEGIEKKTILRSAEVLDAGQLIEEKSSSKNHEVIVSERVKCESAESPNMGLAFPPKRRPWWRYGS